MRTIQIIVLVAAAVLAAALPAAADHNPSNWKLDEITHGEALRTTHPGVVVDRVEMTKTTGDVFLTACCSQDDCTRSNSYRLGWVTAEPHEDITRGQKIGVDLVAEITRDGGCEDITPYISACGEDGCPSPLINEKGITIAGPNVLTKGGGGRLYADPENPSSTPNPHVIEVNDIGNMPHDGYFRVWIEQRWGLDYEFVWIYRAAPPPDDGGGKGGSNSGGASGRGSSTGGAGGRGAGSAGRDSGTGFARDDGDDGDDGKDSGGCAVAAAAPNPARSVPSSALLLVCCLTFARLRRRVAKHTAMGGTLPKMRRPKAPQ